MSVTTWDQVTSITREKVLPGIEDAIVKDNVTFNRLFKKSKKLDGGNRIEKVIRYANSSQGGWVGEFDTLDTAQEQTRTRAYFSWRMAHQPIVLSNLSIAKNGGAGKIMDLVATESEDAKKALQDKFGTAFFTAQSGDQMDSLVDGVDDGTNVY